MPPKVPANELPAALAVVPISVQLSWSSTGLLTRRAPGAEPATLAHGCGLPPGGGSATVSSRQRWWGRSSRVFKTEAMLAATIGLAIPVCHMPNGHIEVDKIEHRLFSVISINWRAKPINSYRVIVASHRRNDHPHRAARRGRPRYRRLPPRPACHRRPARRHQPDPPQMARRMELLDRTTITNQVISMRPLTIRRADFELKVRPRVDHDSNVMVNVLKEFLPVDFEN